MARVTSALVALLLAALAACGRAPVAAPSAAAPAANDPLVFRELADFTLVDQSGAQRSRKDWAGHPIALAMIFTSCAGPCPEITAAMKRLQEAFPASSALRLVSLSVDPRTDTPAVLTSYANANGADLARWTFLTGDEKAIHALIFDGLKLPVDGRRPDVPEAYQPTHASQIVAIDKRGGVRGYYDARDELGWRALRDRLAFLEQEQP